MDRATSAYIRTQQELIKRDLTAGKQGSAQRRIGLITAAQRDGQANTAATQRRSGIRRRSRRG